MRPKKLGETFTCPECGEPHQVRNRDHVNPHTGKRVANHLQTIYCPVTQSESIVGTSGYAVMDERPPKEDDERKWDLYDGRMPLDEDDD